MSEQAPEQSAEQAQVAVVDAPDEHRWEVRVDGDLAGFVTYHDEDGSTALDHTETLEAYAGRGLAKELAAGVLADARERGLTLLPYCPFFSSYLAKHPEHADLVPAGRRAEFGLDAA